MYATLPMTVNLAGGRLDAVLPEWKPTLSRIGLAVCRGTV